MKKLMALLLVCLLALPLSASAAGAPAVSLAGFFSDLLQPTDGTIRYIAAPRVAFPDERSFLIAGTPDGQRLLITNADATLRLFDAQSFSLIPLTFLSTEDADMVAFRYETSMVMAIKGDQRDSLQEKLTAQRESYLSKRGLNAFETLDQIAECYSAMGLGRYQCWALSEKYAYVWNNLIAFIVDMETGALRVAPGGPDRISLCGSRFLYCDMAGKGAVIDLETGEETPVDLLAGAFGQVSGVTAVHLFQDGTISAVGRSDITKDEETNKMVETDYYIMNAGGFGVVCLRLGESYNMQTPSQILVTGDGLYALVYHPTYARLNGALLVNLKSGAVTPVNGGLIPVAGLDSAFLCYDSEASGVNYNYLCTLRPDTLKTTTLISNNGGEDPQKLWGFINFGNAACAGDLLFAQSQPLQGYFTLDVGAKEE